MSPEKWKARNWLSDHSSFLPSGTFWATMLAGKNQVENGGLTEVRRQEPMFRENKTAGFGKQITGEKKAMQKYFINY